MIDARRILIIRQDTLGDVVLLSPFLRELRRSAPKAWITLVVDARFASVVQHCPYVNEVLGLAPQNRTGRLGKMKYRARAAFFARSLRRRKLDLALLPRWDVDYYESARLACFSGADERVGYSEKVHPGKEQYNAGLDQMLTRAIDDRRAKHEVEQNLDFLRAVGGTVESDALELWLSDEDRDNARRALIVAGGRDGERFIALAPGAGHAKRMWPADRYIRLCELLGERFEARIVIVGGQEDHQRGEWLREALGGRALNLAGKFTIRETAAALEKTVMTISNDSGPMHIAAAAGAPVVEISCHPRNGSPLHANSPVRFHPWCQEYVVVQPELAQEPCKNACEGHEAHCILNVPVEMVAEAIATIQARGKKKKA